MRPYRLTLFGQRQKKGNIVLIKLGKPLNRAKTPKTLRAGAE